jgi:hypothetical protein
MARVLGLVICISCREGGHLKKTNLTAIARPACAATMAINKSLLVLASARLRTGYKFRTKNNADHANPTDTESHWMRLITPEMENIWIIATNRDYY